MWYLLIFWMGLNYYNRNCFLAQTFDLFCINCLQGVRTIYEVDLCKINRKLGLKNNSGLNNLNQSKNESQNTNFLLKIPFVIWTAEPIAQFVISPSSVVKEIENGKYWIYKNKKKKILSKNTCLKSIKYVRLNTVSFENIRKERSV